MKFDNLRKRVPVKAPDSGIAINYETLYKKARAYHHTPADLPIGLAPPANLALVRTDYATSATPAQLAVVVARLRVLSADLEEPSAYLTGFILGREAASLGDADLTLKEAQRTTTILGSPAYGRAAAEYSGTFTKGKEQGYKKVASTVASQVLGRCLASVVTAGTK